MNFKLISLCFCFLHRAARRETGDGVAGGSFEVCIGELLTVEVTSMRAQCESNVMARIVRVATQNGFKLTFVLPVLNRASVHGDHRDDAALG